jgi:hypothetical protein
MTPVDVQTRRGHARTTGRRRAAGPGRFAGEATPQLFPESGNAAVPVDGPVEASEAAEPRTREAGSAGGRGDGLTLEQLISGVWDEVLTEGRAACPLCGGELEGRASAHSRPTEGRCSDCETTLA